VAAGLELPCGVYRSTVADCVIGHDALVCDVKLLANYAVGEGALLSNCDRVVCEEGTAFGNGAALPVGLETGGREVEIYAEMTVEAAAALAGPPGRAPAAYREALARYLAGARAGRGVIERGAALRDTPRVENTYVGPGARIDGAALVAGCTLLSGPDEPTEILSGACVTDALLQWGSRVATLAVVERSLLAERACVERHAKVSGSVLGPNTAVAQGEVTASLLGPFVAAHHQSLLIAVFWPEGKGNVSHGASVGCNHTSRAPDQECRAGEGMFFGLNVGVKFPADFGRAPYTLLACGVTTGPQRLLFPFSLVNLPAAHRTDVPPSLNEIIPAWLLTDNLYALARAEWKYRARNQARRAGLRVEVFRPDTVELMRDACRRLEAVRQVREVYTDRDIEGLGGNYLLEPARVRAIDAYRFFIRSYALLGLKEALAAGLARGEGVRADGGAAGPDAAARWEHQRGVLRDEFGVGDVAAGLRQLPALLEQAARAVERSRARDEERGRRVLDDYAETHAPAEQDPVVRDVWAEARRHRAEVAELLDRLEANRREAAWLLLPVPPGAPQGWTGPAECCPPAGVS
jgi:hypothetical protein